MARKHREFQFPASEIVKLESLTSLSVLVEIFVAELVKMMQELVMLAQERIELLAELQLARGEGADGDIETGRVHCKASHGAPLGSDLNLEQGGESPAKRILKLMDVAAVNDNSMLRCPFAVHDTRI
jgi:hypothetical protein